MTSVSVRKCFACDYPNPPFRIRPENWDGPTLDACARHLASAVRAFPVKPSVVEEVKLTVRRARELVKQDKESVKNQGADNESRQEERDSGSSTD